jgi:hypothetical protein
MSPPMPVPEPEKGGLLWSSLLAGQNERFSIKSEQWRVTWSSEHGRAHNLFMKKGVKTCFKKTYARQYVG